MKKKQLIYYANQLILMKCSGLIRIQRPHKENKILGLIFIFLAVIKRIINKRGFEPKIKRPIIIIELTSDTCMYKNDAKDFLNFIKL